MDNKEAAIIPAAAQPDDLESGATGGSAVRRRLLTAGFAGAAASLLPWMNGRASASTNTTDQTDDTTGGTGQATDDDGDGDSDNGDNGGNDGNFETETSAATDVTTGGTDPATELTDPSGDTSVTQAPTGDTSTGGTEPPAPTTTLPPIKHPTAEDMVLLDFAQSVELTARDLYDVAIESGAFDETLASEMVAIREAHEGYATAISGLIGRSAANKPNTALFDELAGDFEGDAQAIATAAAAFEDVAVATHIDLIGQLEGIDGSSLIASIVVIESRIATLLRAISGVEDLEAQLEFEAEALTPSDYPVE